MLVKGHGLGTLPQVLLVSQAQQKKLSVTMVMKEMIITRLKHQLCSHAKGQMLSTLIWDSINNIGGGGGGGGWGCYSGYLRIKFWYTTHEHARHTHTHTQKGPELIYILWNVRKDEFNWSGGKGKFYPPRCPLVRMGLINLFLFLPVRCHKWRPIGLCLWGPNILQPHPPPPPPPPPR